MSALDQDTLNNAFLMAKLASETTVTPTDMWTRACATDAFSRQVEIQMREAVMRRCFDRGESPLVARRGQCNTTCSRAAVHFRVRVFACESSIQHSMERRDLTLSATNDPTTQSALHVCCDDLCAGVGNAELAPYHWYDRTDNIAQVSPICGDSGTGGGVHWCMQHGRMHVCTRLCTMTTQSGVGFAVCVLSGRSLAGKVIAAYGQGTVVMTREIEWQRDNENRERRETMAMRRSAMSAIEHVVETGSTSTLDRSPAASTTKRRRALSSASAAKKDLFGAVDEVDDDDDAESTVYVDVDAPASDLFSNTYEGNTFGDDIALNLARWYAQAYAATHRMLFSDERAAIEQANRQKAVDDVTHRINSYIVSQRKTRQPVCMSLMRQIEQRYMNGRRIYPVMLVPRNGRCRMTSYFSLVCMEFYLQLVAVVTRLYDRFDDSSKTAADSLQEMTFASVSPNVLDLLHEGLKSKGQIIVAVERTLSIYPESQTVEALGFPQKTCTEVKKVIKHCIVAATDLSEPLESLRTTHLDILHVMFGDDSIVERFLNTRRTRLGIEGATAPEHATI